jgi:fatty acid desaturase
MKRNDLSDFAIHRLRQLEHAREQEKKERLEKIKSIAWIVGDVFAWVFGIIAIVAVSMLDSEPWVIPTLVLGVSVLYLALYGAIRGVLG